LNGTGVEYTSRFWNWSGMGKDRMGRASRKGAGEKEGIHIRQELVCTEWGFEIKEILIKEKSAEGTRGEGRRGH